MKATLASLLLLLACGDRAGAEKMATAWANKHRLTNAVVDCNDNGYCEVSWDMADGRNLARLDCRIPSEPCTVWGS